MNPRSHRATSLVCYCFDLGSSPSIQAIQRLLYELYSESRLDPGYLFVSEHDHDALTVSIMRNDAYTVYPWRTIAAEFCYDETAEWQMYRRPIRCMRSYATGTSIRVVALHGLESGSVILGFFR